MLIAHTVWGERERGRISTWNVSYCRLGNCCSHPSSFQVKCECGGCSAHSYWLFFPGEESSSSNRMGLPTGLLSCHCSPFHTYNTFIFFFLFLLYVIPSSYCIFFFPLFWSSAAMQVTVLSRALSRAPSALIMSSLSSPSTSVSYRGDRCKDWKKVALGSNVHEEEGK